MTYIVFIGGTAQLKRWRLLGHELQLQRQQLGSKSQTDVGLQ